MIKSYGQLSQQFNTEALSYSYASQVHYQADVRHYTNVAGEKRFECFVCAKRFMRSDHLSKHVLRHRLASDEPKYVVKVEPSSCGE